MITIPSIFKRRPRTKLLNGHQVIEAFKFNGTQYYELIDIFDIPCERAFAIRDYMEELSMRCTREFLQAHVTAVQNILSGQKTIDIPKLAKLNLQLQERLDFVIDADIVYKLSAAYYFDASEDVYKFNYKYAQKKAREWKEANGDYSFFLLEPVKALKDLPLLLKDDLVLYLTMQAKVNQKHLANIFTTLSESDKKKDFVQTLTSEGQQV